MSDIATLLAEAKAKALNGGLPMRRKDGTLYSLLAGCLFICEKVQREGRETELREAVRVSVDIRGQGNAGKGRRYAERTADAYILVCRHVLDGVDNRNSTYRYAQALRNAHKLQITSDDLASFFAKKGGVAALHLAEAKTKDIGRARTLKLSSWIDYPLGGEFTLTLKSISDGGFAVLDGGK